MTTEHTDGASPSEELQMQFRSAARNRHYIGLRLAHPEAQVPVEDPATLEGPIFLSDLSYEQWSIVSTALQSYESLAQYHRFGSPVCEICPTPEVTKYDTEDLKRTGLEADLLAVLAM